MAKRVRRPTFEEMIEDSKTDVRAFLAEHADEEVVEQWDENDRLWTSGEMQAMIEEDDFSDLPEEVRPESSDSEND